MAAEGDVNAITADDHENAIFSLIKEHDFEGLREYIDQHHVDIRYIHERNTFPMFPVKLMNLLFVTHEISLRDFVNTIRTFIDVGGMNFREPGSKMLHYYFIEAIRHTEHQMVRYLIEVAGPRFLVDYIGDYNQNYAYFVSLFDEVLYRGDVEMTKIFIENGVQPNYPVVNTTHRVFPICYAVYFDHPALVRYFIELGVTWDLSRCDRGHGTAMGVMNMPFVDLVDYRGSDEVKEAVAPVRWNPHIKELTLQQLAYLNVLLEEADMSTVAKYIKQENFAWILATENQAPLVLKAKEKISHIESKRRRRD